MKSCGGFGTFEPLGPIADKLWLAGRSHLGGMGHDVVFNTSRRQITNAGIIRADSHDRTNRAIGWTCHTDNDCQNTSMTQNTDLTQRVICTHQ